MWEWGWEEGILDLDKHAQSGENKMHWSGEEEERDDCDSSLRLKKSYLSLDNKSPLIKSFHMWSNLKNLDLDPIVNLRTFWLLWSSTVPKASHNATSVEKGTPGRESGGSQRSAARGKKSAKIASPFLSDEILSWIQPTVFKLFNKQM